MSQQYGGYNQGYGSNPYDQREGGEQADGGRFNNYSQGRYDDRMYCTVSFSSTILIKRSRCCRDAALWSIGWRRP